MQLIFDTESDDLETVVATLSAAYGRAVTLSEGGAPASASATTLGARVGGGSVGKPARAGRPRRGSGRRHNGKGRPTTADVRAWAEANGMQVGTHGRLPQSLWEQYEANS